MNPIGPIIRIPLRVASFLLMAVTILASFCGYVPPAVWAAPGVLMLFFPYLLILLGVVSLAWFCFGKWIMGGLGILSIIFAMGISPHAFPMAFTKTPASRSRTFTLLTYNICHGENLTGGESDYSRSLSYIINSGADVVVLQEFREFSKTETPCAIRQQFDSLKRIYPYHLEGKTTNSSLLSKYPAVEGQRYQASTDKIISYFLTIDGRKVEILNCHLASYMLTPGERDVVSDLKSGSRYRQGMSELKGSIYPKLKEALRARANDALLVRSIIDDGWPDMIVCGDFNDVADSWVYRQIAGKDMRDANAETSFGYLPSFNDNYFYFRIDQVLYRGNLRALSLQRPKVKASDHYPLIVKFEFTPARK